VVGVLKRLVKRENLEETLVTLMRRYHNIHIDFPTRTGEYFHVKAWKKKKEAKHE